MTTISVEEMLDADIRAVLNTVEGRRLLLGIMKASGMFTASGVADPVAEGRRLLGVSLFNLAVETDWRLVLKALQEDFELAELMVRAAGSAPASAPASGRPSVN
jgi:hypothetical protein